MSAAGLLTVREFAQRLGVHPSTVRRHCTAGTIPATIAVGKRGGRSGQVYMIPASSLPATSSAAGAVSSPISLGTFRAKGGRPAVLVAADRLEIIQAARAITGPNRTQKLRALATSRGIGLSTLYRWMAVASDNQSSTPTLEGAAKTMRSKFDERGMRRRTSIEPEARDFFLAAWNSQNQLPVTAVVEHIYKPKAQEMGWSIPSRATFYRIVSQDLSAVERAAGREGRSALRKEVLPKNTIAAPEVRNKYWVADHRQLDFFVIDPRTGKPVRPWITSIIEGASRGLLGWKLATAPTADSILQALHASIYCGSPFQPSVPEWFLTDNGQDFRSHVVTGTLKDLGIKHRTAEVEAAWQKPVESFFKILSYRFDRFFAWTGHNVMARPELLDEKKLAAEGKLPTFEELEIAFAEFARWYNTEHQHTGDGMDGKTPAQRYAELPAARIGVPTLKAWQLLTMREERRRVSDQGIKMFNRWFWHDALYRMDNLVHRAIVDEWVTVRFDPHDKSRLYVFFEGEFVCVATDKPRPTWDPEDEANMEIAGRIRSLSKKLERETLERLHERVARAGFVNPWIPPLDKEDASEEAEDQAEEADRMITRMDRVAKQIEKQQAEEAPRKRNKTIAKKAAEVASKYA